MKAYGAPALARAKFQTKPGRPHYKEPSAIVVRASRPQGADQGTADRQNEDCRAGARRSQDRSSPVHVAGVVNRIGLIFTREGVHHLDPGRFEVTHVSSDDGQAVRPSGGRDHAVE